MFKKPKNKAKKARGAIRRKTRSDSDSDDDDGNNNEAQNKSSTNAANDAAAGADGAIKKEEVDTNNNAVGVKNEAVGDNQMDQEEESTLDRIMQTKKRRKLKNTLMRQGVSGAAAKKRRIAKSEEDTDQIKDEEGDESDARAALPGGSGGDLGQRLKGTFGGGGDPSDMDGDGGAGEGVLGKKHRAAMEKYIQERMDSSAVGSKNGTDDIEQHQQSKDDMLDEDALYRQVAAEVGAAGIVQDQAAVAAMAAQTAETTAGDTKTKEDDVGAGGMMLAGTGIAEVALPVDERIRTVRETELLASRGRGASMARPTNNRSAGGGPSMSAEELKAMLPTSFGGGKKNKTKKGAADGTQEAAGTVMAVPRTTASAAPGRKPYVASSAGAAVLPTDVANLSQSYSHNFKLHTHQWVADRKTEQQREIDRVRKEQEERDGTLENQARVGFEQARRVARGESSAVGGASGGGGGAHTTATGGGGATVGITGGGGGGDRNRSSDDRVWRSFVSKQRNRR